jgi:hypothetical protein
MNISLAAVGVETGNKDNDNITNSALWSWFYKLEEKLIKKINFD